MRKSALSIPSLLSALTKSRSMVVVSGIVWCLAIPSSNATASSRIVLQGRLLDLLGNQLPDGSYEGQVDIFMFPEELARYTQHVFFELNGGLYTQLIGPVDNSAFECIGGAIGCEPNLVITILSSPGPIQLPPIPITQSPRAGISERVRGDIETGPSSLTIPASDELAPQTANITDGGIEFIGINGSPTFKFDNFLTPTHQLPTLEIADPTLTTFGGPTSVRNSFAVNLFNDATPDFSIDNISGVLVRNQTFSVLPTPTSFFGMDHTGRFSLNANSTPLSDFEVTPGGTTHFRSGECRFDNNDDNLPNVLIESDGNCKFNTDNAGGYDVAFESGWVQMSKPVRVDGNGDGFNDVLLGDNGATSFNPNGDANTELKIEPFLVTMQSGLIVKAIPAASSDNMIAGNNIFFADPNADGTREINIVGGKTNLNGVVESKHDATSANASMLLGDDALDVDVDQDGATELRVGKNEITEETFVAVNSNFDVFGTSVFVGEVHTQGHFEAQSSATFQQPVVINSSLEVNTGTGVVINGDLTVTGNKNFAQVHPTDPTKEIIYTALEAGESGTYTRGSGVLSNGVAVIELPEHFALVTNADGLTAQITPRGPVQSMLYVESVTPTTLIVKSSNAKDASVPFDYLVNGVRRGFEHHEVIREMVQLSMRQ